MRETVIGFFFFKISHFSDSVRSTTLLLSFCCFKKASNTSGHLISAAEKSRNKLEDQAVLSLQINLSVLIASMEECLVGVKNLYPLSDLNPAVNLCP